jgi:hypothetical protein
MLTDDQAREVNAALARADGASAAAMTPTATRTEHDGRVHGRGSTPLRLPVTVAAVPARASAPAADAISPEAVASWSARLFPETLRRQRGRVMRDER